MRAMRLHMDVVDICFAALHSSQRQAVGPLHSPQANGLGTPSLASLPHGGAPLYPILLQPEPCTRPKGPSQVPVSTRLGPSHRRGLVQSMESAPTSPEPSPKFTGKWMAASPTFSPGSASPLFFEPFPFLLPSYQASNPPLAAHRSSERASAACWPTVRSPRLGGCGCFWIRQQASQLSNVGHALPQGPGLPPLPQPNLTATPATAAPQWRGGQSGSRVGPELLTRHCQRPWQPLTPGDAFLALHYNLGAWEPRASKDT